MALIKCPECGKDVSDKATACIHCGFPLNVAEPVNEEISIVSIFRNYAANSSIGNASVIFADVMNCVNQIKQAKRGYPKPG